MRKSLRSFFSLAALTLVLFSCKKDAIDPPATPTFAWHDLQTRPSFDSTIKGAAEHLAMGNPSEAVIDATNFLNYLIIKPQYCLSYNRDRGTPNWVSWHLDPSWLGGAARQDDFRADTSLPSGWYRVQNTDYGGSGFDRGHNTPSADRTSTIQDNSATFLMTNMIPQAPNNNQQTWANLEGYCRTLVNSGSELYIIMGSYGIGGTGSNGDKTTIANGHVIVPSFIWKVVVVLPQGINDLGRVQLSTRIIAVITPNSNTITPSWGVYRTTVNAIELATGYNLLSNLSSQVQQVVEDKVDSGPTQ